MILPWWGDHFGKMTVWSLVYFLNYCLLSYLAQSQILVISLYVEMHYINSEKSRIKLENKKCAEFKNKISGSNHDFYKLFDKECQWQNRLTFINCSRISQLNIPGLSFLYSSILFSTSGVATRGFEPPMTPGLMDPVSWYLLSIFDTQPWLTLNWREITQGRTPAAAISIIFNLTWLGRGRPLMKTPPSWLTRPWPRKKK